MFERDKKSMKLSFRAAGLAALLVVTVSCSSDEDAIVVSPVPAFSPSFEPDVLWTYQVDTTAWEATSNGLGATWRAIWPWSGGPGKDRPLDIQTPAQLQPVLYQDKLYVGNGRGLMVALDKEGNEHWRHWQGVHASGGFSAGLNLIAYGTLNGEVIALNAETGEELWRNLVSSEVIAPPTIGEGKVVVRTIDGRLFALDATSGERLWQADRNVPLLTQRGTSAPVLVGGIVIAGFDNGKVAAFRAENGQQLWEKRIGQPTGRSEIERIADVDSTPVIYGTSMYAASFNGSVVAIDLRNGETQWQRELSTYQNVAVDLQTLVVSTARGHVTAIDRQSGYVVWTQKDLENRRLSAPAIIGDYIVVADFEGQVYWLNRTDGKFVSRYKIGGAGKGESTQYVGKHTRTVKLDNSSSENPLQAPPLVFDGLVLLYDSDDKLTLLKLP